MKKYRLNIDGKEVTGLPGQTILEVALENDIFIPTFCFDERTEIYGACGICSVEVEGNPKLVKACATVIGDNMVVRTDTERVTESRKTNLELLLSNHVGDCRPPCAMACPAHTDCQGYVGLVANGQLEEAIALIKKNIPLPAAIGRVCPHPCEDECRRKYVDEPISIAWIKRFAADMDLGDEDPFMPDIADETGKSVAIIGGGPFGLSLAYFLRQYGHEITIFEAMPKAGGMLRYGIPEYRLPNEVLDEEIVLIEEMGVEIITDTKIGTDINFENIRDDFDAVAVGIGAWVSTGTGAKGEDAEGVIGGIDFLRKVVRNEELSIGKNVAIVGGGNTAMDACRTAVRLGAEKVYNVYRRTKEEMPADMIEIEEAEEEGVIFKNLTNPLEIITGKDGRASKMKLQIMELGEPDESGRRAPHPVKGKTETIDVDTVILAIGQAVAPEGFEGLEKTRKNGIVYDPDTFATSVPGVFAGGDCGNDKVSIAIEAIADAKKATGVINAYLSGEDIRYEPSYVVTRDDVTEKTFEDRERECRPKMGQLSPEDRKSNFTEVVFGYDPDQAMKDAERCLECGCGDYFECRLYEYANLYDVKPDRLSGGYSLSDEEGKPIDPSTYDDGHPFIVRDSNKCILCGLCARVCDEVMGVGALGFVNRGFDTIVKPTLEKPLNESGCISCGQCVSVCPTGALQERLSLAKPVPLDTDETDSACPYCSVGCSLTLETYGDLLVKSIPNKEGAVNKGVLCGKGRFGFDCSEMEGKLMEPLIRTADGKELVESDYYDAFVMTAKKAQSIAAKYGRGSVAVAISDRYTNEEIYAIKSFADEIGAKPFSFNNRENGLARVLGVGASPNTIDELLGAEVILAVGFNSADNPVIRLKLKQAAESGAKVVVINPKGMANDIPGASDVIYAPNNVKFLNEIAKSIIDIGDSKDVKGYKDFAAGLADVKPSAKAAEIAALYAGAKKAMIVFQQNSLAPEAASLLGNIALLSGHIGSPRDGVLLIKPKNNSQGLIDQEILATAADLSGIKALLIFGEDPLGAAKLTPGAPEAKAAVKAVNGAEFIMVCDTHSTDTAKAAHVVIPGTGFASADGTFTNTERRLQIVQEAVQEDVEYSNWEVAAEIAHIYEVEFPWANTEEISEEMEAQLPIYRYTGVDEVFGGVLAPANPCLLPVTDGKLFDRLASSDSLMNAISARLPEPVTLPNSR